MKKIKHIALLLLLFIGMNSIHAQSTKPYVVMLSMDGFRWDYTDKVPTPNFDKIAKMGVKAKSLKPSFPTKTFPNHYSIATGLVPDHHGIVLNSFYDPETGKHFSIGDRDAVQDGSFYGGEPIWVTAEKQGMISGSYFWVGSEAKIDGYYPTYWKKYDHHFPYAQRIDSVIAWLQKPEKIRPHLVLWYLDEPDHSGHEYGPDSPEIENMVMKLDSTLGVFMKKLSALPYASEINVIVTSDHGMESISDDRKVILNAYLNPDWIEHIEGMNPNFNVGVKAGYEAKVLDTLQQVKGITTWKADAVPARLKYGSNPRCLDIVVVADSSWSVVLNADKPVVRGAHGYDNANKDMHAIFYAYGPAFKSGYVAATFDNVDIYPLICEILGLKPAPVDGKLMHVEGMLKD